MQNRSYFEASSIATIQTNSGTKYNLCYTIIAAVRHHLNRITTSLIELYTHLTASMGCCRLAMQ
ncbi:MAG: hypothetical protein IIW06_06670 [Bacteroidaceae bacterium]|nr:hypothetical protein [Bacteroidaceae bacterium]